MCLSAVGQEPLGGSAACESVFRLLSSAPLLHLTQNEAVSVSMEAGFRGYVGVHSNWHRWCAGLVMLMWGSLCSGSF